MNHVTLTGRFTRDIELKSQNGTSIVNSTLAVDRPFKNKEGKKEADFITITAFNKIAELISKYCTKGTKVGVEGSIRTGKSLNNGTTKYYTSVLVENIEFLENKNKSEENIQSSAENTVDPFEEFGQSAKIDDVEVPW